MNNYDEALKEVGVTINKTGGDERIVYGVGCTWWDSITKASKNGDLPCCPYCGSVLFQIDNIDEWYKLVEAYNKTVPYDYKTFIVWLQNKCFKTYEEALFQWDQVKEKP